MLINQIFKYLNSRLLYQFDNISNDPEKFQKDLLSKILKENQYCEYGIKFNFFKIKSIEDFQKNVPIIKYENIKNEIERIKKGKENILTSHKILYFATTSGSTNTPKFIPITKKRLKNFKDEYTLWAIFALKDHPEMSKGHSLLLVGSNCDGSTKVGIPHGSISGYLATKLPWYVKLKLVVPFNVYNIQNFELKIHRIAKLGLETNVSQLGLSSPVEVLLFFDYIKQHRKQLTKEIFDGGNKKRARELDKIKDFKPKEYWPNLVLLNYIKGGFARFYLDRIQDILGDNVAMRDPGIYSSEGRVSLCLSDKGANGVIAAGSNFFEFRELCDGKFGRPITIEALKKGKKYSVLLTTQEGLYRYDLGDIVKVVDFYKKLPVVEFVDRIESGLSIVGEHVTESELVDSVREAAKKTKIKLFSFTVIPNIDGIKPRYEFLIELINGEKNIIEMKDFLSNIENGLMRRNFVYKKMRFDYGRIDSPLLSILKVGSYNKFDRQRIIDNGVKQIKPINLNKSPEFKKFFQIEKTYSL